jgi:uncharacterized protein YdeI (YjbR/CyaY-like superfamily)
VPSQEKTKPGARKQTDYPIKSFPNQKSFRDWLGKNHAKTNGLWLRFYKKASGKKALTRIEALDEALCFGWIDGQANPLDDQSWLQKFTPRRPKSAWSKINTGHAERLIQSGQMTQAGFREIEKAKADGRWTAAYCSPRNAQPPADFLHALGKNKKAKAFFATLNRANIYSIVYRLQTAKKPETREKRMKLILAMMAQGKTFHPQRKPAAS